MNIGTPYGLAFSSGINAYLPLLSFSIAARWFHLYSITPQFAFVTQDWFMILMFLGISSVFGINALPARRGKAQCHASHTLTAIGAGSGPKAAQPVIIEVREADNTKARLGPENRNCAFLRDRVRSRQCIKNSSCLGIDSHVEGG